MTHPTNSKASNHPPKIAELLSYCFEANYHTNDSYKRFIDKKFKELDEKDNNLPLLSRKTIALNLILTEEAEVFEAIDEYLELSVDDQIDSWFHNTAIGLWHAWIDGDSQEPRLIELARCINNQIMLAKVDLSREFVLKAKPIRANKVDVVHLLMVFVENEANILKTAKALGKSAKPVREHLKSVVGDDYRDILKSTHPFYEYVRFAYKYWHKKNR